MRYGREIRPNCLADGTPVTGLTVFSPPSLIETETLIKVRPVVGLMEDSPSWELCQLR